ncbi:ribonuclease BN [Streptomyces aureus]|uniref:ribonuclease BN n=1 Tax=Streptomyces aureus TaxID=193461 RepID=UPI003695B646
MPMKTSGAAGRSSLFERLSRVISHSPVGRGWRRSSDLELVQRSLGFAALGFITLVPLLIIVSSADPEHGRGFAQWLGEGLGVSTASRERVEQLFTRPGQALRTTTVLGIVVLAAFGLAFGVAVQSGYEKVWDLPPARWWARWRHVVWLGVLIGYLFVSATTTLRPESLAGAFAASLSAVLFFWWSQRILLGGRVRWYALLPGAVATMVGLLGLRVFSLLVYSPLIASNTITYGPVGTVLVIQSWLVGVGLVVFGGALVGRLLHEELPRVVRALKRRGHGADVRPEDR